MDSPKNGNRPETDIPLSAFTEEIKELENNPRPKEQAAKKVWSEADRLRLDHLLKAAEIDLSAELKPAPVCLYIVQDGEKKPLFSLGDLSLITGQAKSKKTFFTSLILSAFLGNSESGFISFLPPERDRVLLIDTEQKSYDVQKVGKRIMTLSNGDDNKLIVLKCRGASPSQIVELIGYGLDKYEGIGFVVIDGIVDLVSDSNDLSESNKIATTLMNWTENLNIHILTILHQNKGNNYARGHLGTVLQNKSETVLSVRRSEFIDNLSEVTPVHCRMIEPRPFAFKIDENGLPHLEDMPPPAPKKGKKKTAYDYELTVHHKILRSIFKVQSQYKLRDLKGAIATEFLHHGDNLSQHRRADFIDYYKMKGFLIHHPNGAHSYYTYTATNV